ncbi:unnamed protein product, partial [marine sediment metagenome]
PTTKLKTSKNDTRTPTIKPNFFIIFSPLVQAVYTPQNSLN